MVYRPTRRYVLSKTLLALLQHPARASNCSERLRIGKAKRSRSIAASAFSPNHPNLRPPIARSGRTETPALHGLSRASSPPGCDPGEKPSIFFVLAISDAREVSARGACIYPGPESPLPAARAVETSAPNLPKFKRLKSARCAGLCDEHVCPFSSIVCRILQMRDERKRLCFFFALTRLRCERGICAWGRITGSDSKMVVV